MESTPAASAMRAVGASYAVIMTIGRASRFMSSKVETETRDAGFGEVLMSFSFLAVPALRDMVRAAPRDGFITIPPRLTTLECIHRIRAGILLQ